MRQRAKIAMTVAPGSSDGWSSAAIANRKPQVANAADIAAIKEVVSAQFRSLAWAPNKDADWATFRKGFLPGAMLFPAARPAQPQMVEQFADRMNRLRANGTLASFEETPLGCVVRVFGNVAVAMAGCEMFENGKNVTRDVSGFLLVRDGRYWRIAAQAWDMESASQKIPTDLDR